MDAQYGTNVTWDYYNQVHGRNGIFGNGSGSYNRTHYGSNYVNAFWDGTKMTYGDGDGVNYGPLVSLDVAGHEMSHGVTENTAALTYSGESGGLNEATSDIFGTMVEFFANNANDPADYLIGEEFDLANHAGFRRMDNPIADGSSPNCYSSNTENLDVHYSSGVGNHFFYLLAEGSGAKTINGIAHNSPTCNGSTVTGIGRDAAQRIWFRALTVYMTSGTTYSQARTATLNAARDLYGAGSTQLQHRGRRLERRQRRLTRLPARGEARPRRTETTRAAFRRRPRWSSLTRARCAGAPASSGSSPPSSSCSSRCAVSASQPASVRNARSASSPAAPR